MADVKLNTLPQSTSPTSTQDLLLFDESTNAGQRINYNTLADVILAKLTSKTYTVGGGTQTLISAIDALNSNLATEIHAGTVSEFLSSLQTLGGSMQVGSFKYIKYTPSETTGKFVSGHVYGGLFNRTGSNYWAISLADPEGNPVYGMYRNGTWVWDRIAIGAEVDALNSNLSSLYCREYSYAAGTSYKAAVTDVLSKLGSTIARYWIIITIGASRLSLMIIKDGVQWSNGILTSYASTGTDVYFVMSRADSSSNTVVSIRKLLTGDLEE